MNVSCNSNENIYEATITISFPCKQTIMEHDIKKFNLTQVESRIWNLINLLVKNDNKERQPHQKIFFMKDISTMIGTHNWNVWVKHVKHRGMIVSLLFITCKQLISISFETYVSSLSKKSISHEHLNIKDISYQQQVFPLFHNIGFSSHFFVTFESIRKF